MLELTTEERAALVDILTEDLGSFWETLKEDGHQTVDAAMVAYDADALVGALRKLDASAAAANREYIKEELQRYFG